MHRLILMALATAIAAAGCGEDKSHRTWTTSSGLHITEIVSGEGDRPKQGDVIGIVYTASYVDGDQFDSYTDATTPYRFRHFMHQVMPGLDEGVSTMRPGGKRILVLPPNLAFEAYPDERPASVPVGASVRFEVEMIEVLPSPTPPEPWIDIDKEIVVTNSGLQYVEFRVGEGESPKKDETILVHYSGFLDDGTLFDTTYFKGVPLGFKFDEHLLEGWIEGISTMKPGGQRKLIIPPHLGYGNQGFRRTIPPNATLIYDITLIRVEDWIE